MVLSFIVQYVANGNIRRYLVFIFNISFYVLSIGGNGIRTLWFRIPQISSAVAQYADIISGGNGNSLH